MRAITIYRVMNGFAVQVGCQTLVFETQSKMMAELGRFLSNPQAVEEEYLKTYGLDGNATFNPTPGVSPILGGQQVQYDGAYGSIERARECNVPGQSFPSAPPTTGTGCSAGGL